MKSLSRRTFPQTSPTNRYDGGNVSGASKLQQKIYDQNIHEVGM